jgi:hypothetical protein
MALRRSTDATRVQQRRPGLAAAAVDADKDAPHRFQA